MTDQRPFKDHKLLHLNTNTKTFMAWVRRPSLGNVRFYIGCYNTFHMAARAQDRAILRIDLAAPLNFRASDYEDDATLRTTMSEDAFLKMLKDEARPWYKAVAKKSQCFTRFQRLEEQMKDLRTLSKFTIREFVAHLTDNPSPSPELNDAALTLLEIFGSTHVPGIDDPVAQVTDSNSPPGLKGNEKTRAPRREGSKQGPATQGQPAPQLTKTRAAPWMEGAHLSSHREAEVTDCSVKMEFLEDIPKGKRSPRTLRKGAVDGGAGPCSQGSERPRTRGYCKRKLDMTSLCPYRLPHS